MKTKQIKKVLSALAGDRVYIVCTDPAAITVAFRNGATAAEMTRLERLLSARGISAIVTA